MKIVASSTLSLALLGAASSFAPAPHGDNARPSYLSAKYERMPIRDVRDVVDDRDPSAEDTAPRKKAPRKSEALPFAFAPAALDGTLAGDFGFDPLGFSVSKASLSNYREAEVKHGRLAMLAAAGWPLSELWDRGIANALGMDPLLDDHGRVPSVLNGGMGKVSLGYWAGCLALAAVVEIYGSYFANKKKEGYIPGDLGFDPLGFYPRGNMAKDVKDRENLQLSEIKHGRLAMIAITAFAFQEFASGTAVVDHASVFFRPIMDVLNDQVPGYYIPPEVAEGASTMAPAVQEAASTVAPVVQEAAPSVVPEAASSAAQEAANMMPQAMQAVTENVEAAAASAPAPFGGLGEELAAKQAQITELKSAISAKEAEAASSLEREISEANTKIADLERKLSQIEAMAR